MCTMRAFATKTQRAVCWRGVGERMSEFRFHRRPAIRRQPLLSSSMERASFMALSSEHTGGRPGWESEVRAPRSPNNWLLIFSSLFYTPLVPPKPQHLNPGAVEFSFCFFLPPMCVCVAAFIPSSSDCTDVQCCALHLRIALRTTFRSWDPVSWESMCR